MGGRVPMSVAARRIMGAPRGLGKAVNPLPCHAMHVILRSDSDVERQCHAALRRDRSLQVFRHGRGEGANPIESARRNPKFGGADDSRALVFTSLKATARANGR